ncbi:M14 family zinc carboxypeptidase [Peribacillus deserti]|uniref:Peptidase M14 n=1 Tax=Peribacillus deserti TaxID=673318 RepID=A0A2N5LZL0_9BACI|nr:M14 family zinc carboxypeptidase [Peribacillus deserti]PLT27538.1 peptidase M14 [Peribacillus deserti]
MDVFVRQGDTLWYYSTLFKVNTQLIIDSNPDSNPDKLAAGQRIRIPGFVSVLYTMRAGDSLWSIAQSRNLPLDTLFLVNLHINPVSLRPGQTLLVPLRITWRIVQLPENYDYETMMDHITRLQGIYPFLRMTSIGHTVLGREIPELLLGFGEKRIHYNASFHANEWITTAVVMAFLNDYLLALTNGTPIREIALFPLYEQALLSIVPMVNPDGVNLVLNGPPASEPWRSKTIELNNDSRDFSGWKANIRGVDLNDQFPARWELEKARNPAQPGPRDYAGERPLTEPEAIAMADLIIRRDYTRVLAFHTQGEVIYWGFENLEPPESAKYVRELGRVSGYEPVRTIESYAGYKDWFIQDWRRPGFTIELGRGVNPLPLSQFNEIYEEALGIFLAGIYL